MVVALAWLPLAFVAWYLLAPIILWPVELLATIVGRAGFGDLLRDVERHGSLLTFVTTLQSGSARLPALF